MYTESGWVWMLRIMLFTQQWHWEHLNQLTFEDVSLSCHHLWFVGSSSSTSEYSLSQSVWTTDLLADIESLEFKSKYLSVWVDFLYTEVCIDWLGCGMHLLSRKEVLYSLSGWSMVSFIYSHLLSVCHWIECHMYFLGYADDIIYILFPPRCGYQTLGSKCQFFKIFHIDICYSWWYWETHCCSLELFVEHVLEWEHTVVQDKFQ